MDQAISTISFLLIVAKNVNHAEQALKDLLHRGLGVLLLAACTLAEPVVPWAEPQNFPQQNQGTEVPIFERAMREERRRKELGISGTIDVNDLKTNPTISPQQKPGRAQQSWRPES
jgi:uncharacterized lipoprotein YajG